ncbi:MAG: hypothetical protein Q8R02_00885 [Hyphomonadaceae bacterium]|nr:hypothetical protein [Hyphomonadaceae bacterium]
MLAQPKIESKSLKDGEPERREPALACDRTLRDEPEAQIRTEDHRNDQLRVVLGQRAQGNGLDLTLNLAKRTHWDNPESAADYPAREAILGKDRKHPVHGLQKF